MFARPLVLAVLALMLASCTIARDVNRWFIGQVEFGSPDAREDLYVRTLKYAERVEAHSQRCPLSIECSEAGRDCHKLPVNRMYKPDVDAEKCHAEGLAFGEEAKSLAAEWDAVECENMIYGKGLAGDRVVEMSAREVAECWRMYYRHGD